VPVMTTSRITSAAVALTALALASSSAPSGAAIAPTVQADQDTHSAHESRATDATSSRASAGRSVHFERYAYRWPVKPFGQQHPVRGFFGDPRISNHGESRQFHFGIDISAPNGTPVYATVSGRVQIHPLHATTIAVVDHSGVEFSYWHVVPVVRTGQHATAYRTVLGHIEAPYGHVHFSERRQGRYVNPLRPGAMGPFSDSTRPGVFRLTTEDEGRRTTPVAGNAFDLIVEPRDETPLAVPRPWHDLPVMPAIVRWRLLGADGGTVIGWRTVVDFRETIPAASEFDRIWAAGTTQNHVREPGRYRLYLAREGELSALRRGSYIVEVALGDTRRNGKRSEFELELHAS
jgi:hypothetical protein